MGFGGFFNYDRPGPGIKKDGPKKKTFFVLFEIWWRNIWKLCVSSLVYSALTILLIPGGLGAAGITNVARNLARDKHSFGLSDFIETVKKNWKQSLVAGIINLVIDAINAFAIYFYWFGDDALSIIGFGLSVALFILFRFMKYHVWLMIITFKLSLKQIYKNSFLFAFVNWKANLIIGLTEILLLAICVALFFIPYYIAWVVSLVLAVMVFPGFINLLTQLLIFPKVKELIIDPYYEEHPDEDVQLRVNLGIEVENEEDSVFEDKHIENND